MIVFKNISLTNTTGTVPRRSIAWRSPDGFPLARCAFLFYVETASVLAGWIVRTLLDLWNTQVSDAGLNELAGLRNLTTLFLDGTGVSDAGVAELKKEWSRCQLIRSSDVVKRFSMLSTSD
ncbi:hypothetical protein Isop_2666 [Isosphaera pallida ATCC 43644]|uniref:Uncharacterized protein n=1 Tax=Isosphaera pallida (strain ATCC 43644 / DSM 9630 / IS1B) TaxID=575540 RepID=E8QZU5_ISOPI|nr:hypothetical protein [Isosphaera pallida]ADV63236.1 hypothetical protein Isop_2666 [Isosphaera pallida ATCC 43644]